MTRPGRRSPRRFPRRFPRPRPLLAAALLAGAALAAFGYGSGALRERADLAFCNQEDVGTLDPARLTDEPSARLARALFEGLTRYDAATLEPLPGAAVGWATSPDGRTWRFQIRQDARWSNGDPVLASDFVSAWRRLLAPSTAAPYAELAWVLEGARDVSRGAPGERLGVEARGPHELEVRLERPCPYLLQLLALPAFMPVHAATVERLPRDWTRPEHLVGNGPFRLIERRLRDRIRLERSPTYWGVDEVRLRTVEIYATSSATTQLNLFLTGEVDWIRRPPPTLYGVLLERPDARVSTQLSPVFLRFNTTRPPLGDARVRRALRLAIDREALARDVLRGGERPATSFVPEGVPGYRPAELGPADVDTARRLLAEAGYEDPAALGELELLYPAERESAADLCHAVAEQWRARLGVRVHLVQQVWKVYLDSQRQGLYDVSWSNWSGDYLDASTFLDVFHSENGNNRTGWSDPGYDARLEQAARDVDPLVRARRLREAEARLLEAAPLAPLIQRVAIHLVAPRVRGFHENLLDVHPLRDLWVEDPR